MAYKRTDELKDILNSAIYEHEAKLAAAWEMEKRKIIPADEIAEAIAKIEIASEQTEIQKEFREERRQKALQNLPQIITIAAC
ncbi:MAG: hypothetical protein H7X71_00300, partial [Chitinophagales bacterium]|nr:hypothetical protein [Chitinophagales bacterium]